MTNYAELFTMVKRARNRCLDLGYVIEAYIEKYPDANREEVRRVALQAFRAPFPSISGNPPVDRDRPYNDLRFHVCEESDVRESDAGL